MRGGREEASGERHLQGVGALPLGPGLPSGPSSPKLAHFGDACLDGNHSKEAYTWSAWGAPSSKGHRRRAACRRRVRAHFLHP